jgi:hypothetical protein
MVGVTVFVGVILGVILGVGVRVLVGVLVGVIVGVGVSVLVGVGVGFSKQVSQLPKLVPKYSTASLAVAGSSRLTIS